MKKMEVILELKSICRDMENKIIPTSRVKTLIEFLGEDLHTDRPAADTKHLPELGRRYVLMIPISFYDSESQEVITHNPKIDEFVFIGMTVKKEEYVYEFASNGKKFWFPVFIFEDFFKEKVEIK